MSSNHVAIATARATADEPALAPPVVRLHSLAELGQVLARFAPSPAPDGMANSAPLDELLAQLVAIEHDLAAASAADARARRQAEDLLARYERAQSKVRRADDAVARAEALCTRATDLCDRAFTPAAREAGDRARATARAARDSAIAACEQARAEEATLAAHPEVQRLMAERKAREDAARLLAAVEAAQALADRQQLDEARVLLAPLLREFPGEEPLRVLDARLAERQRLVRVQRAHATLWDIRRRLRQRPAEALVAVEGIDFAGLDEDLARQLFGEWLRAARRLDLPGALRSTPARHQAALLVPRVPEGGLVVVSAIGGCPLRKGQVVAGRELSGLASFARGSN